MNFRYVKKNIFLHETYLTQTYRLSDLVCFSDFQLCIAATRDHGTLSKQTPPVSRIRKPPPAVQCSTMYCNRKLTMVKRLSLSFVSILKQKKNIYQKKNYSYFHVDPPNI